MSGRDAVNEKMLRRAAGFLMSADCVPSTVAQWTRVRGPSHLSLGEFLKILVSFPLRIDGLAMIIW